MTTAKRVFTLIFLINLAFSNTVKAQFNHAVGAGINYMTHKIAFTNTDDGGMVDKIIRGGVDYFPRYNFVESENSSFSVGAPLCLGLGSVNTGYESGFLISGDASIAVYYNNGHKATRDLEKSFGFFVGGGFSGGFSNLYLEYDNARLKTYGPMAHVGVRFPFSGESGQIGLFYRHGLEADKFRTYGLKFAMDF